MDLSKFKVSLVYRVLGQLELLHRKPKNKNKKELVTRGQWWRTPAIPELGGRSRRITEFEDNLA